MSYMSRLINYLHTPFPLYKKKWIFILIPTGWVFFITLCVLIAVKPLGMTFIKDFNDIQIISLFTLATLFSTFIVFYTVPFLLKKYSNHKSWTKGRFFLYVIVVIGIIAILNANIMLHLREEKGLFIDPSPIRRYLFWYLFTFIIGIVPSTVIFFMVKYSSLRVELKDVMEINQTLKVYNIKNNDECVTIYGSVKEKLEISPDDFLYAEVSANYVTIYMLKNGEYTKAILRTTLYKILESFQHYPQIVRCHRAFVVNTSKITKIKGNSKAYQLDIYNLNINIPVSRTYTNIVRGSLNL